MDQPVVDLAVAKTRLRTRLEGEAGLWLRDHALSASAIAFASGLLAGRSAGGDRAVPELIRGLGVVLGHAFVPRAPAAAHDGTSREECVQRSESS